MLTGKIKRILFATLMLCEAALLAGCSNTELEESNFPLAAVLDYEEDSYQMTLDMEQLSDIADEKAAKKNKTGVVTTGENGYKLFETADINNPGKMDYNHMKALVLNSRMLEDDVRMEEILSYLEEQEVIARNTLLFVTDASGNEIIGMHETLGESVGTYLDEMIASDVQTKKRAAVTLGTLYNTWNNDNENLYIPYLTVADEKLLFEDYYLMQGRNATGTVSRALGDMALLTEGRLKHYGVELSGGEILELSQIRCRYDIEKENSAVTVTVRVSAEARRMDGKVENDAKQVHLAKEAKRYLEAEFNKAAEEMKREYDVDISNSFYLIGGYNRAAYEQYRADWELYRKNLTVVYDWEIVPVNL